MSERVESVHSPANAELLLHGAARAGSEAPPRRYARAAIAAGLAVPAGYLALLWRLDGLPFQDLPNHLARAVVELDLLLHGGARFGSLFAFEPQFSPYLGGDVLLAGLVAAFGPSAAGKLWVVAVAASLPLSLGFYLRATRHERWAIVIALFLSLYLTTDVFFVKGFHHYRLAVACVLFALGAWELWLRAGSAGALLAFTLLLMAGYLFHLSALVFGAVGAAVVALVALRMRETRWRRAVLGHIPVAGLLVWHAVSERGLPGGDQSWRAATKIVRVVKPFYRFDWLVDGSLLLGFALVCGVLLVGSWGRRAERRFVTSVALALAFLATYAALPFERGLASAVDVRAIPLAAVFALVASLAAPQIGRRKVGVATGLAIGVAAMNLVVLSAHLLRQNRVMLECRNVAAQVPAGARVLPIDSGPSATYHHCATFATIEAGAYTPYLFSNAITPYFRDRARVEPLVAESWYKDGKTVTEPERAAVAANFDYLLVLEPFDSARLGVPAEPVARDGSVTLLEIMR